MILYWQMPFKYIISYPIHIQWSHDYRLIPFLSKDIHKLSEFHRAFPLQCSTVGDGLTFRQHAGSCHDSRTARAGAAAHEVYTRWSWVKVWGQVNLRALLILFIFWSFFLSENVWSRNSPKFIRFLTHAQDGTSECLPILLFCDPCPRDVTTAGPQSRCIIRLRDVASQDSAAHLYADTIDISCWVYVNVDGATVRNWDIREIDALHLNYIPVVPHKAVAEVSKIGNLYYRRCWLWWITDGRANPLMDREVVGVVIFGVVKMVAVVTPPQLLDVVWCSAVVIVVVV